MKCLLASSNRHKAEEFSAAFKTLGISLDAAPYGLDVVEDGLSFLENAAIKARAYAAAFGQNALADDSGLSVDALNGAPGIYSARYAEAAEGEDATAANNKKLIAELRDVPAAKRTAYFTCALCLVLVDPIDLAPFKKQPCRQVGWRFWDAKGQEIVRIEGDGNVLPTLSRAEFSLEAHAYGHILLAPQGEGGFGYDPLFYSTECGTTFAKLSKEQKLAVSHRGKAIASFVSGFNSSPTCGESA